MVADAFHDFTWATWESGKHLLFVSSFDPVCWVLEEFLLTRSLEVNLSQQDLGMAYPNIWIFEVVMPLVVQLLE